MTAAGANYPVVKGSLVNTANYTWNTADALGRGASAVVYLGRHNTKGDLVAVKVFHDCLSSGFKENDTELLLLRKLTHVNVIKLLDIERQSNNNKCVLVLEYCEGASLHHMLDQPLHFYGLHEEEFLRVLTHVCAGIQYLRRENVIHRDIKPGNIMRSITEDGMSVYKLTDFGAARNLDDSESFQSLCGTEEYLHPAVYERAVLRLQTNQSFDAKVDLWSLGVTFYHTATGQLPFQAFGGRSNRLTMFDIISQKESGVISGVQKSENSPIEWKSDLPETSPLTSGLKSVVIPLLAGLMEPNEGKMLTYDAMFRIVQNIEKKMTISVFHYNCCEELIIYAEPDTRLIGLKDEIARLTDIPSGQQILLTGGQLLEKVVGPLSPLSTYPESLRASGVYLFQRVVGEPVRLARLEFPLFPPFPPYANIDEDARLAHNCAARGELIRRYTERISQNQVLLMDGQMCLRVYVENRLAETKISEDFMLQLMEECKHHYDAFCQMVAWLRDSIRHQVRLIQCSRDGQKVEVNPDQHPDVKKLDRALDVTAIGEVQVKARDRIDEIQRYGEQLKKKIEDIKGYAIKFSPECQKEKCIKKVKHRLSLISAIQSRFRRDKSVRNQMTEHDQNIHRFERQKLQDQCNKMKTILLTHCQPQLEALFKNRLFASGQLIKCLERVHKIERNINSVLSCQKLLTDKLLKQRLLCERELSTWESGYGSYPQEVNNEPILGATGGGSYLSDEQPPKGQEDANFPLAHLNDGFHPPLENARNLHEKLQNLQEMLTTNSALLKDLDETTLYSSGSMTKRVEELRIEESRQNPQLEMCTDC